MIELAVTKFGAHDDLKAPGVGCILSQKVKGRTDWYCLRCLPMHTNSLHSIDIH